MDKKPFVTLDQIKEIVKKYPTPFHIYDEKGIRENARLLKKAFSWNKGFKEFFAVKATPNPYILQILKEEGAGVDCFPTLPPKRTSRLPLNSAQSSTSTTSPT